LKIADDHQQLHGGQRVKQLKQLKILNKNI